MSVRDLWEQAEHAQPVEHAVRVGGRAAVEEPGAEQLSAWQAATGHDRPARERLLGGIAGGTAHVVVSVAETPAGVRRVAVECADGMCSQVELGNAAGFVEAARFHYRSEVAG